MSGDSILPPRRGFSRAGSYIVGVKMQSMPPALLLLLGGLFAGCMEEAELTARTAVAARAPDCASCHAYPLEDENHHYHLFHTQSDKAINGPVTCMDCHATSVARRPNVLLDTIFVDPTDASPEPNEWSSVDFPVDPAGRSLADTIRAAYTPVRVDTLRQERPVPAPEREGRLPELTEYMTSLAHMNGVVDVVFHPRVTDTAKFPGMRAEFNRPRETCSAVACHPRGESPHWRFAAPSKGLSVLRGYRGDVP